MAKFLDALRNANLAAQGWRWAAFATTGMMAVLSVGMVWVATHQPVILVPAEIASAAGPVKVAPGNRPQDAEYLGIVASNDIALALTWTPDSVGTQFSRFLNRMTPSLYAAQNVKLIEQAAAAKDSALTQAFFPEKISVAGENKVRVTGILARWEGEKQTYRASVSYLLVYQSYNGFLHVDAITAE
jgi:hypothetical protein